MSYGKKLILSLACLLMITTVVIAQTESQSLQQQFDDVWENSESFKQYKVVPKTKLTDLFKQINDSIAVNKRQVSRLQDEINTQTGTIESLESQLGTANGLLENSKTLNESISFLGATFKKSVYNGIVWSLIILLIVAAAFVYMLFKRSHKITRTTQNDLRKLTADFDSYKTTAHEKQVKLKRELQTAMNTLHEKGIKV